jgi:hypothetical protein
LVVFRAGASALGRNYKILFVEFLVLVVGVFVSLQVNEWQNDRANRELELQYLLRLEDDFEKSSTALKGNIKLMRSSLEKLESGLTILTNEKRSDEDYQALFLALQGSAIMGSFEVFLGTFEELKDTGNMQLIESTRLRESLGNLWQKYLRVDKISQIRNILRGNTFPAMARHVKPLQGNKLTFDAEMVERNPRDLYVAMSIIRSNLGYDLADSEEVLSLVNAALGIVREEIEVRN